MEQIFWAVSNTATRFQHDISELLHTMQRSTMPTFIFLNEFNLNGHILLASARDIDTIRSLCLRIYPLTYQSILSDKQIRYMLDLFYAPHSLFQQMEEGHQFFLWHSGTRPVGFASLRHVKANQFKLEKIYLLPEAQGKGTGRSFLSGLIRLVKNMGGRYLTLHVNRMNKAKVFYEKMGFRILGTEDTAIGSGYFMCDFVMEKSIEE